MTPADADEAFRLIGAALAFLREKYEELRRLRPILDVSLETTERLRRELAEARDERAQANEWLAQPHDARKEIARLNVCLEAEGKRLDDLAAVQLAASVRAAKAEAEVERLKWESRGAPMAGETSGVQTPMRERVTGAGTSNGRCWVITGPEDVCGRVLPCDEHPTTDG